MENIKWINSPTNDIKLLCETHCPSFTCSCAYYNNCSYCNLKFSPGDDYWHIPLNFYLDNLANILFSGKEYSATLINMLQTYILDSDNNVEIVAEKLFIHENSHKYRLKDIENNKSLFFNKPLDLIILTIISIITRKKNMV